MSVRIEPVQGLLIVDAASTASLTLSGIQTVDGVSLTAGKLCLAKDQASVQAVYLVQSGAWIPVDPGLGFGLQVLVRGGSQSGTIYRCTTADPIVWGTTATSFVTSANPDGANTFAGIIEAAGLTVDGAPTAGIGGTINLAYLVTAAGHKTLVITDPHGDQTQIGSFIESGTCVTRKLTGCFSVANNATGDIDVDGLGGHLSIVNVGATSSTLAAYAVAANGAVSLGGLTYTGFSATQDNANTVNVYATSGPKVRIQNKTGGTVNLIAEFTLFGHV